jgi:hypothetical protein
MSRFSRGLPLSALLLAFLLARPSYAAEALSWKFAPGLANRYRTTTTMDVTMDLGPGGQQKQTIVHTIDLSWTVDKLQDDGSAILKQKIDRVQMKIAIPGGQTVEYDSKSTDEPQSFAAMVAPLFREMTRAVFTVTMSPRGKVSHVEVPEALIAAIAASPGAQLLGDLATAEGFKTMISRSSFELPETLEPGVEWSTTAEIANPILGKQTIVTTYKYTGPKEVDGIQFESFAPTLTIDFAGGPAQAKVTQQGSEGEILFNRTEGRLESMNLKHNLALALTQADKTINQTIDQNTEMKWLPKDAE